MSDIHLIDIKKIDDGYGGMKTGLSGKICDIMKHFVFNANDFSIKSVVIEFSVKSRNSNKQLLNTTNGQ